LNIVSQNNITSLTSARINVLTAYKKDQIVGNSYKRNDSHNPSTSLSTSYSEVSDKVINISCVFAQ